MLEGVILFIIHSFFYFILFAVVLVLNGKAANQVRLAKKNSLRLEIRMLSCSLTTAKVKKKNLQITCNVQE